MAKQRHPNCKESSCSVCMEDCYALSEELEQLTDNHRVDHLGKYEYYLRTKLGIETDNGHGWPSAACFDEENIKKYVAWMKE